MLRPVVYYKVVRYTRITVAVLGLISLVLFAAMTGLALLELRVPEGLAPAQAIRVAVAEAVMPNTWLLVMALALYAASRILSVEEERARMMLVEALYSELSLYGRYRLDELVAKYGFRDAAELVRFLEEVKTRMDVSIQIDPQGEEVYVQ